MGLPSTLDKGTRKSQPLPESTTTHPKDSEGNIQPLYMDLTSTTSDEGTAKTTSCPKGSLRDKDSGGNIPLADMEPIHPTIADLSGTGELDTQPLVLSTYENVRDFLLSDDEAQESKEDILGAGEEMDKEPQAASIAETHHQSPPPQADKPQSSHAPSIEASDTDSSCDHILKKYDNTLPLTERQLVKYLRKVSNALFARLTEDNWENHEEVTVNYVDLKASIDEYYNENIDHRDQTDKLVEASMSSLDKSSNTISDLYKGFNIITELLKEIKMLSRMTLCVTLTLALTHIPANVEGENDTNTATEDPLSYTERETDANRQEKSEEPKQSTDANIELIVEDQRKLVKASSIIHPDPDALIPYIINGEVYYFTIEQLHEHMDKEEKIKQAEEESKLFTISNPEVIKKAQDAEHEVLKRQHTEKVRKSIKLRKHKFDNYMWTINSRLKPETIIDIKIHPKTKPVVITFFRGTDGRNFDVHKPFAFALPAPAPAPEQASSKSSRKKRKNMELEPEIKILGLECNRALLENVPFINNMAIEEP
ncbi:hypothetical protein Tco_1351158 [Tanacetum coccineum]